MIDEPQRRRLLERCLQLGALALGLFAGACERSHPLAGTGETHFLHACSEDCGDRLRCVDAVCTRPCEDDAVCRSLAVDATCEAPSVGAADAGASATATCDVACSVNGDCEALGRGFACEVGRCRGEPAQSMEPDAAPPQCADGCSPIYAYGEDPSRGCVDRSERVLLGCDCNTVAAFGRCARRVSDDTLWALHASEEALTGELARCTIEESGRVSYACEFASCEQPPLSTCTLAATCGDRGCDNLQFEENGCQRPSCNTDAECSTDARCVRFACVVASACTVSNPGPDETCGCAGGLLCVPGGACNPVATVGPAGAWQKLVLLEGSTFPCGCSPSPSCCARRWELEPSGALAIKNNLIDPEPRSARLSDADLAAMTALVDGPSLRAEMRDGLACQRDNVPVPDRLTLVQLEIDGATLEQLASACAEQGDSDFARLRAVLTSY